MKLNYEGNSEKSGIYKIINTHTNRVYIGSASRFDTRWKYGHVSSLRKKKHQNKFLQADFDKCQEALGGTDDFLEFYIIQLMDGSSKEERKVTEQVWIDKYFDGGKFCYNLKKNASVSRENVPSKNPEETRKKLSAAGIKRMADPVLREQIRQLHLGKPKTPEAVEKMRCAKLGKEFTEEHKMRLRAAKLGKKQSPEHIANAAATRKGKKMGPMSAEVKEKQRQAHLGKTHSQETKQKLSETSKGKQLSVITEEGRQRIGEWSKAMWQDPEQRAKVLAARKNRVCKPCSEETKRKIAEKAKQRWAIKKQEASKNENHTS